MIKNIGVDQIEVDRIAKVVDRGDGFARKVLTDREFAQYQDLTHKRKIEYLAAASPSRRPSPRPGEPGLARQFPLKTWKP